MSVPKPVLDGLGCTLVVGTEPCLRLASTGRRSVRLAFAGHKRLEELMSELCPRAFLAYDGLEVEIP